MDIRERLTSFVQGLPVAHRAGLVTAAVALLMLVVVFGRWLTTPSYTVLYSGLAEKDVAAAVDELETLGVPYELASGGTSILVPRDQLYATRASLAEAGVAGHASPAGYELLDNQGLSISDFRQHVDYRRALEGELAKTLLAMDGIAEAQVHLVIPEQQVFTDQQQPATASVLVTTRRQLSASEVDAITFLVASAVEGLEPDQITVADSSGTVLHAPGDVAGGSQLASRQLRQTREFEQALASDIGTLLTKATGSPASVVVRASLDFDQAETQTESYDKDSQVAVREQTTTETYKGTGVLPGGTVGVDGGPVPNGTQDGDYQRDQATREYGVDKVTSHTVRAPGTVQKLSVAIVMDDGSLTGTTVPKDSEVQQLVAAAVGLDQTRGDTIAVSRVPMPKPEDTPAVGGPSMLDRVPQFTGVLVLLLAAGALFLMTRQRVTVTAVERLRRQPAGAMSPPVATHLAASGEWEVEEPRDGLKEDVVELVRGQPEEIAALLRGWLADRRGS